MSSATQEITETHVKVRIIGVARMLERTQERGMVSKDRATRVTAMLDQARAALAHSDYTEAQLQATSASALLDKV